MENNENKDRDTNERVNSLGATEVDGAHGSIYCLSIIGQVEGHYALDNTQKTTKTKQNNKTNTILMFFSAA